MPKYALHSPHHRITMSCYFVRHGQTNYNIAGLCNDNPDVDVHLTASGIHQAEQVADTLREVPLQRILVSPLPRTRQTAEIINRFHHIEIEVHPGIADIRSGFEGQPVEQYQQAIAHDPLHASANGGESLLQHKQRVSAFLHWLAQQEPVPTLVVAHEETLRVINAWFLQLDDEDMIRQHFENCQILRFECA